MRPGGILMRPAPTPRRNSRAAENVPIAVEAEQALRADIEAFTTAIGIRWPWLCPPAD